MERSKHYKQIIKDLSISSNTLWIIALLSSIFLSSSVDIFAQQRNTSKYQIALKSRTFTPRPGISSKLKDSLAVQLERGEKRHVYLQLKEHLNKDERRQLEEQGIKLLGYIGACTWHATLSAPRTLEFISPTEIKRSPIFRRIRWIGEIQQEDKIQQKIRTEGVGEYNRHPDNRVDVVVIFFTDVSTEITSNIVNRYGEIVQQTGMLNDVVIRMNETDIKNLAKEDVVQWIEEVGPPDQDGNDNATLTANINPLWMGTYNLDGTNVQIGQWESGNPDNTHGDLAGRIHVVENVGVSDHGTHVAGTAVGDGSLSAGEGGAPNQWRGVANQAEIFSYSTTGDDLEPEDHNGAINDADKMIDISTNSWWNASTDYTTRSAKYDMIVRGIYNRSIPIVFIAGNGGPGDNTVGQPGGTAKNTIVVGNINSDLQTISTSSGRGPTDNNQTKPDVVAPGDQTGGDNGTTSCIPDLFIDNRTRDCDGTGDDYCYPYDVMTGTSMAAPVVSGTIALMLQQYRQTYFDDDTRDDAPLPSTFKAILCHTAGDLIDNPGAGADLVGPDYVYGYGLINAQAAVDAIEDQRFLEGVILSDTDEDIYTFYVPPGEDELKVTLAWDDTEGTPGIVDILQNDLDLLLINPTGNTFYTPWELDPANPGNPANRNSFGTEVDAEANRDNVNVLEQVVIDAPDDGDWTIKVKAADLPFPYQQYSIIAGDQPGDRLEGNVDIVQVLDRSGSMGGSASSTSPDTKIEVLRLAAAHFIEMMKPDIGNQLGIVQFNQNVVPFDVMYDADLSELTTARAGALTHPTDGAIASITHGGSTSIGDGLQEALTQFSGPAADPDHDHVVLLVTDGKSNTPLWISDVEEDLINNEIAVYPLGLGYSSGINEDSLSHLADVTGGSYRITSEELIFRKFFIEVLAGAVDWLVIADPIKELAQSELDTIPVVITADQTGATFTSYWESTDNAIKLELITPSGMLIDSATTNNRIRYGRHPRYVFYQLDFPLNGDLSGEWEGEWKMKLTGTQQIPDRQTVRYSASAFAERGLEFKVDFDKLSHLTGDKVKIIARLEQKGKLVSGAKIDVYCDIPLVGAGNILFKGKIDPKKLKKGSTYNDDPVSLIEQKLQILNAAAGTEVLQRGTTRFELYDDGQHGDGGANDGIYSNKFTDTQIQGSYTFRFVASGIPTPGGQKITREWTESFYNEVKIDPAFSDIDVKLIEQAKEPDKKGWYFAVKVAPRDQFGNYRGPGRPVSIDIVHSRGSRTVNLNDNIDGTYTKDIFVTQKEVSQGAKLVVKIDGKTFTTIKELPIYRKWSLSAHLGTAIPAGTFANNFDPGMNIILDVDYHFTPVWSLVGLFGYNRFKAKSTALDNTYWNNVSVNVRYYKPINYPFIMYAGVGPGLYIPKNDSTEFGANLGLGLDYEYNSLLTFELGMDYHTMFGPDVQFLHTHAGVIFSF